MRCAHSLLGEPAAKQPTSVDTGPERITFYENLNRRWSHARCVGGCQKACCLCNQSRSRQKPVHELLLLQQNEYLGQTASRGLIWPPW